MQAHQHMVVQSIKEEVKEKSLLRMGSVMSSCKGGRGKKRLEGRQGWQAPGRAVTWISVWKGCAVT